MKLSLCIATYNEENNIHYPLDSAYELVDEVIIVDGGSSDKTIEKAQSYGKKVKVFIEKNPAMFHINKQKALERAKGEWILQLDADEALSKELREEITVVVNPKSQIPSTNEAPSSKSQTSLNIENRKLKIGNYATLVAFYVPRKNFFLTRFLMKGGQYPDYTIRLYKNGAARFPCKSVHENVEIINPKSQIPSTNEAPSSKSQTSLNIENSNFIENCELKIGYLKNPILHYADPDFSRYLKRWDRYTSLEAELLYKVESLKSKVQSTLMFFDYFVIKPTVWFVMTYFRHKGFMDGFPGFVFALFSSIRFWAVYIKWWKKIKQ